MGAQPVLRSDAPAVAGHEPREVIFGDRSAQIVADHLLVLEELRAHDRADRVAADVLRARAAATIPVEPCQRVFATAFEATAEDVSFHSAEYRATVVRGTARRGRAFDIHGVLGAAGRTSNVCM